MTSSLVAGGQTAASDPQAIVLSGVTHRYRGAGGDVLALDRTDLVVEAGQFVCLLGPSGCGKTTLLRLVAGFLRPTDGLITVGQVPVEGPSHERGVVFQQ